MRDAGTGSRTTIRSYEDLEVYQRSMRLLLPLHELVRGLPDHERYELGRQLRRSSKSIPANIAEGYGKKRSAKEFKSYLGNALGSANETIVHLEIALQLGYANEGVANELTGDYTILAKQLYTLINSWRSFDNASRETIPLPASRVQVPDKTTPLFEKRTAP